MKKEEYNYFNNFISIVNNIEKSTEVLKETLENYNYEELDSKIDIVHKLENEDDDIVHEIGRKLIKEFLPPIDREDITLISHRLDDEEDDINEILINFKILNLKDIKKEIINFINLIERCISTVKEIFINLENFSKSDLIKEKIIEINSLEDEGDLLYEKAMYTLYSDSSNDPLDVIKWTRIYDCFEDVVDSCERIGDVVDDVILKNA